MRGNNKLMEMLVGYAASHQHPVNVLLHMIGIPTIMLGVLIPLTWIQFQVHLGAVDVGFNLAHIVILGFFLFYLTLEPLFAVVFLVASAVLALLAQWIGSFPLAVSGSVAAAAFFGGYAGQFVGHYIERSMPVLVKHPIQANLAAPFFTVVELFKFAGLRQDLFDRVQQEIAERREAEASEGPA